MGIEELKAKRREVVRRGIQLDEAMGDDPTFDQRLKMRSITNELASVDRQIKEAAMADGQMRAAIYGGEGANHPDDSLTPGEAFVRSEAYQGWVKQYPREELLLAALAASDGRGRQPGHLVHQEGFDVFTANRGRLRGHPLPVQVLGE